METYAQALNIGIPVFVLLMLIELIYSKLKGLDYMNNMDTISSLSSGITNITKDVLGLTVVIISYSWLVQRIGIFHLQATWWVYLVAFIGQDFAGYWSHRMDHKINFFWNRHIVHHSSEEYNLACALRQTVSVIISFGALFLLPMALLGVPGKVFALIAPLHLFLQFWYHTRLISRMGFLEYIIMTPSHHRVHHAINPEYIDKNFSPIFILWDKWFGTFQVELDEVPPVYGVKRAVATWNPLLINFQHAWLVITDAWRTESWWDKTRVWFMPTGWRPADVAAKYPIEIIEDVYQQKKYAPEASVALQAWSYFQMIFTLFLSLYLFNRIALLPFTQVLLYGAFIFLTVFSYTTLMDRKNYAWMIEGGRAFIGAGIILFIGDWFRLSEIVPVAKFVMLIYFAVSFAVVLAFTKYELAGNTIKDVEAGKRQVA